MSATSFVRVYVREVRAGDLAMGWRDVFVLDADLVYPSVFSLPSMSVSYLMAEDFEAAVPKELTPAMAKSVLQLLENKKPNNPSDEVADAIIRITQYAKHVAATAAPARQRIRVRPNSEPVQAGPITRVRQRAIHVPVPPEPVTRTRVRVRT